jgi:hypothetical protein
LVRNVDPVLGPPFHWPSMLANHWLAILASTTGQQ